MMLNLDVESFRLSLPIIKVFITFRKRARIVYLLYPPGRVLTKQLLGA